MHLFRVTNRRREVLINSYCSSTELMKLTECSIIIDEQDHSLCVPKGRRSVELWKSFDGTHTLKSSDMQHFFVSDNAKIHESDESTSSTEIQHW